MKYLLISLMFVLSMPLYASALSFDYTYNFSGSDPTWGGPGSATMHVTVDDAGTQLVASILNTSPTTTVPGGFTNSPGIDGFGFFLDSINPGDTGDAVFPFWSSWSLSAYGSNGTNAGIPDTIGSDSMATGWDLQYQPGNVNGTLFLDYNATNGSGVDMALYNPDVTSGTSPDPYYTEAILTINLLDVLTFGDGSGAYVRMQNVGLRGEGSLKLFDYWEDGGGTGGGDPVPEPSTFILLGAGLAGLAFYRRKKH